MYLDPALICRHRLGFVTPGNDQFQDLPLVIVWILAESALDGMMQSEKL
jgi:hypothetical protein